MQFSKLSYFILCSISLLVLVMGLYLFNPFKSQNNIKKDQILLGCKAFSKEESVGYFGRDVVSAGYKPVKITIGNSTNRHLKFSLGDISLKTIPAETVVQSVYYNTRSRATGWGISSLFIPILLIPGILHTGSSYKSNQRLYNDFMKKAAKDQIIAPNSRLEGIIFVDLKDYNNLLSIVLTDNHSNEKIICKTRLA